MKKMIFILIIIANLIFSGQSFIVAQKIDSLAISKEFTEFEEALKFPEKVYRLNLSNQSFKEFPREISKFKNLEYLSLRNDNLVAIQQK
jgi:Leucine-rich repeat (LRR) protein